VAFEARNGGGDSIIVFKDVLLNTGNRFSSSTGKFTAPYSGLHLCAAKICHNKSYIFYIKKNGYVMEKKEVTTSNTAVVCSSLTCVTYLETGDKVNIYVHVDGLSHSVPENVKNEFIGWLR